MDFKIERPQHFCAGCKKMFGDGEAKVATLAETAQEGAYQRRDFCIDCWGKQNPEDFRCTWVTAHTDRRRPALLDADLLWQVLHAAAPEPIEVNSNNNQPPRTATTEKGDPEFAYVAALALLRLKQLSMDDVRREKTLNWYLFRGRGASNKLEYLLRDPGLTEADITTIQDRLAEFAERRTKALTTEGTPRGTRNIKDQEGGDTMIMASPPIVSHDIEEAIGRAHDEGESKSRKLKQVAAEEFAEAKEASQRATIKVKAPTKPSEPKKSTGTAKPTGKTAKTKPATVAIKPSGKYAKAKPAPKAKPSNSSQGTAAAKGTKSKKGKAKGSASKTTRRT